MKALVAADLAAAQEGSYYTIAGVGGQIGEWLTGYEELLVNEGIGKPQEWFTTTGGDINVYAMHSKNGVVHPQDCFPNDLVILMFPLDGLNVGRLALFRLRMQDRWFDDIIQNMRVRRA